MNCHILLKCSHEEDEMSSIYHFGHFSRFIVPIHDLVKCNGSDLNDILSGAHTLTGCDINSKVGKKAASCLQDSRENGYMSLSVLSESQN